MKSFFFSLVVAACALQEGAAFTTPSQPTSVATSEGRLTSLQSSTVGNSNPRSNDPPSDSETPRSLTLSERHEMDTIRGELVQKYIALGHSDEYATREVNYFLEDSERSAQFVEMRKIAMARGNDLGIENYVQFVGAFSLGMLGSWALHQLHAVQAAAPDGGLPWIS